MLPRTPSQTVGPFYAIALCRRPENELDPDGRRARRAAPRRRGGADSATALRRALGPRRPRLGPLAHERRRPLQLPRAARRRTPRGVRPRARSAAHQLTRIYLRDPGECAAGPARTRRAARGRRARFDIRLQGDGATVFFQL